MSGHARSDANEAFGLLGGGEQLGHALVGKAVHADVAVRFGPGAQPGDGFRAVAAFVAEWIEVAFGVAAAAHILNHDVVAVTREPDRMRIDDGRGDSRGRKAGASAEWDWVRGPAGNNDRRRVPRRQTCGSVRRARGGHPRRSRLTSQRSFLR